MRTHIKLIVALAWGGFLLPGLLCQTVRAENELAKELANGPALLAGNWSVIHNDADSYICLYSVNAPSGFDTLATGPEIVYAVSVNCGPAIPNANELLSQIDGSSYQNDGPNGPAWAANVVGARTASPFEPDMEPNLGNTDSVEDDLPAPWNSIPHLRLAAYLDAAVPEPTTGALLGWTALALLAFLSTRRVSAATVLELQYCHPPFPISAPGRRH
jgi:hypothetical protein